MAVIYICFYGTPLQYSCLENPMDRGAWKAAVRGVAEGRTRLSDFTFTYIYIYIFFFRFFSIIVYYKILNIVPFAV